MDRPSGYRPGCCSACDKFTAQLTTWGITDAQYCALGPTERLALSEEGEKKPKKVKKAKKADPNVPYLCMVCRVPAGFGAPDDPKRYETTCAGCTGIKEPRIMDEDLAEMALERAERRRRLRQGVVADADGESPEVTEAEIRDAEAEIIDGEDEDYPDAPPTRYEFTPDEDDCCVYCLEQGADSCRCNDLCSLCGDWVRRCICHRDDPFSLEQAQREAQRAQRQREREERRLQQQRAEALTETGHIYELPPELLQQFTSNATISFATGGFPTFPADEEIPDHELPQDEEG